MSFKVEYAGVENADDTAGWAGNGQRFATQREGEAAANELRSRVSWFRSHRVVETDDPVNFTFDFVSGLSISLPEPIWVPGAPVETPAETAPPEGTAITDVPPPVANVSPPVDVQPAPEVVIPVHTPPDQVDPIHAEPEAPVAVEAVVTPEAVTEPEAPVDVPSTEPAVPSSRKKKADTANTAS